jgi:hypothetical protein
MPYTLITGQFHIHYPDIPRQGPEPDGDTLKFEPDNPALVDDLGRAVGVTPDFNGRNMINLRFEGIDALELHFSEMHQQQRWSEAARDAMLRMAGFRQVRFFADLPHKVEAVQNHPRPGYILTRTLDTYGRIICFVFSGQPNDADGARIWLEGPQLGRSMNAKLMAAGLVYPAFYTTLPAELREHLAVRAIRAWNQSRGLWPDDTANKFWLHEIPDLATLETLAIWPKLFRRLAKYFAAGNHGLAGFDAWLRADPTNRDDRLLLPNADIVNMHNVVETQGNYIRMTEWPEDIVILPDNA